MKTFSEWLNEISSGQNDDIVEALQELLAAQGSQGATPDQYGRSVNYNDMAALQKVTRLSQRAIKQGTLHPDEFQKLFNFQRRPGTEQAYAQQIQKCIQTAQGEYYAPHYKNPFGDDEDE